MTVAILYLYITGNADAKAEAKICFILAGGWAIVAIVYVAMTTVRKTYRFKMVSAMIRPEQLNIVVDALKEEDYIMGMTVTKVKGFGRQKGHTDGGRGDEISLRAQDRVDVVVREWDVQAVMEIMGEAARTGQRRGRQDLRLRRIGCHAHPDGGERHRGGNGMSSIFTRRIP